MTEILVPAIGLLLMLAVGVALVATLQAARRPRVLCLMYHRIAPRHAYERLRGAEQIFTIPEDAFEEQLAWLGAQGVSFVGPDEIARHARGEAVLPDRSILLTIDDGCACVHQRMLPILRRHGAPAAVFVTTDPGSAIFAGEGRENRRMMDDEIRRLVEEGLSVGSHGVSHAPLSAMDDGEIEAELRGSKQRLEEITGRPVTHFAVPANWYDERVLRIAREVGYESVYISRPDSVRAGSGAYGIPRLNIDGHLDLAGFRKAVTARGIARRRIVMALRGLPKQLVGPERWSALRATALARVGGRWLSPSRMGAVLAGCVVLGAGLLLAWLLVVK